jgi:hypothetical protein
MRLAILLLTVCVAAAPIGAAEAGKDYRVEYDKKAPKDVTLIHVTFERKPPEGAQVERILRREMGEALKRKPPGDVLMYSWDREENPVRLPDGSGGIVYDSKQKRVITSKEFMTRRRDK